ncbi:hypothetical protein COB57_06085 [Candidatus Peregrinibacteria bacterium]|nr:MAG: hypothetical protein COB57_06085 [Candidatus Peregrinibacteria bacterium]
MLVLTKQHNLAIMKYLTLIERKIIEKMLRYESASYRSIGKVLKKSHTTISYEIHNNQGHRDYYNAEDAHVLFLRRQLHKGNKTKIERNKALKDFILDHLKEGWSPNAIAGYIKRFYQK